MTTIKLWCTKCDCLYEVGSIAMDCPTDGYFMTCPKCMHRIVIFIEGHSKLKKYISVLKLN